MLEPESANAVACPECGAQLISRAVECCWLCGTKLESRPVELGRGVAGERAVPPNTAATAPFQFSLATLLWITTFVAVEMGLLLSMPGLGIVVGVLALPGLVRSRSALARKRERGMEAVPVVEFLTPLGVVALIGALTTGIFFLAVYLTILATCTLKNDVLAWFFLVVGGLATLVVPIVLLVRTWPRRAR